ncbi:MAG: hypothetical protein ACR5LA_04280 [Wolbachia sp.]
MSLQQMVSSQCLTLGSRKIDCKQTHYTTFSIKSWIPVSATLMTSLGTAVIKEPVPATLMTELL